MPPSFIAAIVLAVSLPLSGQAANPIVIKFSHVAAPSTPKGLAAEKFKELAELHTQGRVKVEVYPNSQLYKDRDEVEALQLGSVQMLAPSLSKFGPMGVREFEVFDLPYLFPNKATLYRVLDGPLGKELLTRLEPKGLLGLAFWDNGFKQMSANKPLRMPADFKGLQMRIQPSKVLEAQMRVLGANPVPMAFGEVRAALRDGVVGGTENPLSNFYTQKMYAVQKHLTLSDHGYLGYAVIVNKRFWRRLPADIRAGIEEAVQGATDYERAIAQKENDEALERLRAGSATAVHTLTDQERVAWHKRLTSIHKDFSGHIGKRYVSRINEIAAEVERETKTKKP